VTDAFGISTSSVNVTVVSVTDVVTAAAAWRGPRAGGGKGKGVGGQKGGKLTVTATSSIVSPTVNLDVVGFGSMTNLGGGNYSLLVTGVASPPDFVTVRSSLGGSATVGVAGRL
jgi:hypothetical protein